MATYYHGGPAGIPRFGFVQPPSITGAKSTADFGAAGVCRRDRVYVTTSLPAAMMFASGHADPRVYVVEPVGELEPDDDCNEAGMSFTCVRAWVKSIIRMRDEEVEAFRAALAHGA